MLRRLMGLILIISILMPVILGAVGFFVVRQIVADVEDAARGPLQDINTGLNDMQTTLNQATQAFQGLASEISSIASTLGGIGSSIGSLATSIGPINLPDVSIHIPVINVNVTVPIPDIPSFSVPGLTQLRNVLNSVFGVFSNLTDVVRRIGSIASLPQQLNGVVTKVTALFDDLRNVGAKWLSALSLVAIALLVWVSATYVALVYRWLTTGWRMLRGLPDA